MGFSNFSKILFFLIVIINSSCSTVSFKNYEYKNIDNYNNLLYKNGLAIAIDPIKKSDDCIDYFGIDLIKNNILPVYIIAHNKSERNDFLILKEKITMKNVPYGNIESNPGKNQADSGQSSGVALAGTGGVIGTFSVIMPVAALAAAPVLMVAGGKQITDANNIKHNFVKNEFYNRTILPGQSNNGFLYLKLPDEFDMNKLNNYVLSIISSDSEKNINESFEFKL